MKPFALRIATLLLTAAASVSAGAVTVFDNLNAANDPWLITFTSQYHTNLWVANRIPIGTESLRINQVTMDLDQFDGFELQVCATSASANTPFMGTCAPFTPDATTPGRRVFTGNRVVAAGDFAWVVMRSTGWSKIRRQITNVNNDGLTWYSGASHNPNWVAEPQTSLGMAVNGASVQLDGVCGSASGSTPLRYAPEGASLCSVGTANGLWGEEYRFAWQCQGEYGGNPSPECSAPRAHFVTTQATGGGGIEPGREVTAGQQASFTLTIPPGYTAQASGCGGALSGSTYTTAAITGPCTVSASFTPPPANGACGDTAPSLHWPTHLCSAGSPTNPFATSDAFRWNCAGTHGGTTAACQAPRQYTVTVNMDEGIASAQCTPNPVTYGFTTVCTATVSDPVARPFSGWGGACNGTGACMPLVFGPTTVSAHSTPITYAIATTSTTGGSVACTPNPVPRGQNASCTATPDTGYHFTGWAGDCSGTGACQLTNVTSPRSVSATFAQTTYPIATPTATGGSVYCTSNPVPHGQDTICIATPDAGHHFTSWSDDCAGTATACILYNVTGPRSVNATFALNTYAISITPAAANGTVACAPTPVNHGQDASCTATPDAGFHFTGWTGDCSGTGACQLTNVTASRTVSATFTPNTHAIATLAAANGPVTCTPNPVNHGQDASCTATPDAGYHFTGWTGGCSGTGACQLTNVTGPRSVSATFALNTYAIATPAATGGSVACSPNPVPHGQSASCTATPDAGYHFTGWSGDCSGTGVCQLTNVTSPRSVSATFALNTYPISITPAAANGTVTCAPNPINHGQDASCTATPDAGYHFTGWSGDCSGTGACQLTNVTGPRSVSASFALNVYPIAIHTANGTATCTPNPVTHGQAAACTATAHDNFHFTGWTGDCTGSGACTLWDVTGPRSVSASFALNTYAITTHASNGTVTCTPNPVTHGQDAHCTATADGGYHFSEWTGDCSGSGACALASVTAARSVSATFVRDPIDATCGAAADAPAVTVPTTHLCATGTPGSVLSANGQYGWECAGEHGGTAQQCSAPWANAGTGTGMVQVHGGWQIASAAFTATLPAPLPPGARTVHAPLALMLDGGNGPAQVTVTFTEPAPAGAVYLKYGPSREGLGCTGSTACTQPHWYALPGAVFSADRTQVTLTLTDGGDGDSDGAANGRITDPGLPVLLAAPHGAQPIPILSTWALALLAAALALLAGRRKHLF